MWAAEKAEQPMQFRPAPRPVVERKQERAVWSNRERLEKFDNYQSPTQHIILREFKKIVGQLPLVETVSPSVPLPGSLVVFDSGWYEHSPGEPLPPIESFKR